MSDHADRVRRYREVEEQTFRALVGDDMNAMIAGIEKLTNTVNTHIQLEEAMHKELASMITQSKSESVRRANQVLVALLVVFVAAVADMVTRLVGG